MRQIEARSVNSLIPYANNSRTHSDAQVSQVAASIKEFGFTNPVLIDEQGGIIAGHGRVMAAKKLGLAEVPHNRPTRSDLHPTMKPVALVERMVTWSSKYHETVLDVFGGSGSTLIACEKAERHARLMELDPKYCDVIVRRWQDFTGKQAIHEATGKTYAELKNDL